MKQPVFLLLIIIFLLPFGVLQTFAKTVEIAELEEIIDNISVTDFDQAIGQEGSFADKEITIGFSQRSLDGSDWYEKLVNSAVEQAKYLGINLVVVDAQGDISKQASDLETLITRQVDAIILNPQDSPGLLPAVKKVHQAGIPLVVVNSAFSQEGSPFSFVSADAFNTGLKAGQELAKAVIEKWGNKKEVKAAVISGFPGELESDLRRQGQIVGYSEYMLNKFGRNNLNIVSMQYGNWLPDVTMPKVEDILIKNPDLDIIFSACDGTTQGIISGLQNTGKLGDILIASIDGRKSVLKMIKEGDKGIVVSVMNHPVLMGKSSLYIAAYKALGTDVPERFILPNPVITPENIDKYYTPDSTY